MVASIFRKRIAIGSIRCCTVARAIAIGSTRARGGFVAGLLVSLGIAPLEFCPTGAFSLGADAVPSATDVGVRAKASGSVLAGVVTDSLTGRPIPIASVRLDGVGPATLTASDGSFAFGRIQPGAHRLAVRHVAYETAVRHIRITDDTTATRTAPSLHIRLILRELRLESMEVRADRVLPLTSGEESRSTIPREVLSRLPIDDAAEVVALMPGVVMSGDRPYFRGAGYEQILPLIDGVPAREPIRGEWILPPPEAIGAVEMTGGSFEAEYGQAVAGIFSVNVRDGGESHSYRLSGATDRLEPLPRGSTTGSDRIDLAASGPFPLAFGSSRSASTPSGSTSSASTPSLFYSAAVQARLSDTYLAYSHAKPEQTLFGIPLGGRMEGTESAMARITWARTGFEPQSRPWRASLTLLHSKQKTKRFHEHYSRAGWVGYRAEYGRYTTYIGDPAGADSALMNDSPPRVGVRQRASDLAIFTLLRSLSTTSTARAHLRLARHTYRTRPDGRRLDDAASILNWLRTETTRLNNQEDPFYATHGYYPDLDDGESREIELGTSVNLGPLKSHRIGIGAGGTIGAHRFLGVVPGAVFPYGSLTDWMHTFDAYAYAQDTWYSDALSSMTLGMRWDHRAVGGFRASLSGSTVSPRLSFRHPMTDLDMLHVQIGLLYQFPSLQEYFLGIIPMGQPSSTLTRFRAQRARAFEVGFQHHFSRGLVGYFGGYAREYSEVIFSWKEPGDNDAIFRSSAPGGPQAMETYGFTMVADHRFHPAVSGQVRAEVGRSTRGDIEAPWSRTAQAGGWLFLRPILPIDLSLSWIWDSGAPYDVCIKPKGCSLAERYRGRLPDLFETDMSMQLSLSGRESGTDTGRDGVTDAGRDTDHRTRRRAAIVLEVRNVFDRRIPTFDFGIASARVGVANFIAYYDRTGTAGGYLLDLGDQVLTVPIDNPQTRTAGRTVRIGIQVEAL